MTRHPQRQTRARTRLLLAALASTITLATCTQLTGVPPKARCTPPQTFAETLRIRLDTVPTLPGDTVHRLRIHLGGCP